MGIGRPKLTRPLQTLPEASADRRRFHRVEVDLGGRLMLADRREFPCVTKDISPGGVAINSTVRPGIGELVIVYLDVVGRIEGTVVRYFPNGFAMTISASPAAPLRGGIRAHPR